MAAGSECDMTPRGPVISGKLDKYPRGIPIDGIAPGVRPGDIKLHLTGISSRVPAIDLDV